MRLDLADEAGDRLIALRRIGAGKGGLLGNVRRAEHEIKAERNSGHDDDAAIAADAAMPRRPARSRCSDRRLRSASAAASSRRDISTRADSASASPIRPAARSRSISCKLILIDEPIAAAARGRGFRPSGHSTARIAAAVITAKMIQSIMYSERHIRRQRSSTHGARCGCNAGNNTARQSAALAERRCGN